jgi:transposase-like protein
VAGRNRKHCPQMMAAAVEASRGRDKQIYVAAIFGLEESTLRYWRKKAGPLKPVGRPRKTYVTPLLRDYRQDIGRVS